MTIWQPRLDGRRGPRYLAICNALAEDIEAGQLNSGDRLPTHRDLAFRLGVTVGTVSRAYGEATRRGLLSGEVGRGSFVREPGKEESAVVERGLLPHGVVDLSLNQAPVGGMERDAFRAAFDHVGQRRDISRVLDYQFDAGGSEAERVAVATFLVGVGAWRDVDEIVMTAGVQHGLMVALAALAEPGDVVLTEALTYPGFRALANMLHLRPQGVALDGHGLIPEALEEACTATGARVLYLIPTLQNPTTAILPRGRREQIAAIARRHGVVVIEDDIYGFLAPEAPERMQAIMPEQTVLLGGTSKSLAPGLRIGVAVAPRALAARIAARVRASLWMPAPPMAAVVRRLVEGGDALRIAEARRREAVTRERIARQVLGRYNIASHPASVHLWMALPEHWRGRDLISASRQRQIAVTPAETFAVTRGAGRDHIRISLGGPRSHAALRHGLRALADLLAAEPDLLGPAM
ncbi:MAG: PLP-dependent aminotransferase family protein [Alphaproteobacteria bacterium]|nr:PLP-dependent aminotransferase family protein [Alphaproteobacteria bacterium]